MGIRVSHQPAAAVTGGAAFTGGQGELLRYLQGLDLQYARMAQDDAQQMRALQFQAAQQQSGQQARLLDQMLGMNFSAQRDMWQAQQRQGELAAERGFMEKRDAALGDRRMAEMTAGHGMDMERMEAEWAARNRMALSEMDAKALADGSAVYDPAASARLAELDRAEQELMTEPKFDARQRQEGLARVQRERQAIRPRYLRPDERQPSMDEEFQTRVLSRPEGVFMRQPDGEWTFQPNKNEDPAVARMERAAKIRDSITKMEDSLLDSEQKLIETEMTLTEMMVDVPGPIDPVSGKPGISTEQQPRFNEIQIQEKMAPLRNMIAMRQQRIQMRQAELEALEQEAMDEVRGMEQGQAQGQMGGGMGGQLPMLPPEGIVGQLQETGQFNSTLTGEQLTPPPELNRRQPQQAAAPQTQQHQAAQQQAMAGMDVAALNVLHAGALAEGDKGMAAAVAAELQRRGQSQKQIAERINKRMPPDQQAPKGYAFPNNDPTKVPLPVFESPEQVRAAIKSGKLKPGQHFIDGNTGKTIELAQQ